MGIKAKNYGCRPHRHAQPVQSQKEGEQMTLVFLGGMLMGFGFGLIAAALLARYDDMKNEIEELKKGKK